MSLAAHDIPGIIAHPNTDSTCGHTNCNNTKSTCGHTNCKAANRSRDQNTDAAPDVPITTLMARVQYL